MAPTGHRTFILPANTQSAKRNTKREIQAQSETRNAKHKRKVYTKRNAKRKTQARSAKRKTVSFSASVGKADVVDNRLASWVFPCGSASITVNTKTHAHRFCYEEKWPPKCMEHYGDPARSQQRSIFRENPTNVLTFVAR